MPKAALSWQHQIPLTHSLTAMFLYCDNKTKLTSASTAFPLAS